MTPKHFAAKQFQEDFNVRHNQMNIHVNHGYVNTIIHLNTNWRSFTNIVSQRNLILDNLIVKLYAPARTTIS